VEAFEIRIEARYDKSDTQLAGAAKLRGALTLTLALAGSMSC
jgi:hypothetical protein